MENILISNRADLALRLVELKEEKIWQEAELRQTFKEFATAINPVSIVKESIHELAIDNEVQFDLIKVGLNFGANLIIDRIMGRHSSIRGYISSVMIEKISKSFINNNVSGIISGISKIMHKNNAKAS